MFNPELDIFNKIKIASAAGFDGIEIWHNEIVNENLNDVAKCLSDHNIKPTTIVGILGWFENDGNLMNVDDNEEKIFEECKRRIETGCKIKCPYIIAAPAFSHRNHFASWEQGVDRYNKIVEFGIIMGCVPTLEFIGQSSQINTFFLCEKFLNDLHSDTKMIIDSYHLWRGGGSMDDFINYDAKKISVFHISDANKNINRLEHKDRDRVMPFDGRLDLHLFKNCIKKINYDGFINLGVYNKNLWKIDPIVMAKDGLKRLQTLFN